ncbi:hypothetical protein N781_16215 [Pontibacillus halophilus JSM 076056 = DSM 19796]|uniref:Ribosomal protein L7/L12 C-terminal domain-containing protein n=1 Tax=Pontibacillus halophilus JSM 076056 = DSM 19796 TaxID=1385510 RepID=A0A0A5GM46_9BACI|nr:hypothetical protein [Pontibacillus halophilus]KGX92308.1 hypothetical protein N781_16215 [Pontibacillus halophilus JSM 076056 = DSM 19796]
MEFALVCVVFALAVLITMIMMKVEKLEGRLKLMEQNLDRLANHLEVPEPEINEELREIMKDGEDVRAVKRAREALGLSLVEAKEYVDRLKTNRN